MPAFLDKTCQQVIYDILLMKINVLCNLFHVLNKTCQQVVLRYIARENKRPL